MQKTIVIFTIGTMGDVRPCIALGQGIQRTGHHVRIATSSNFRDLVRDAGLEFSSITADFQTMLEADRTIADQGMDMRAMARIFRDRYADWARNWVAEGLAASDGAGFLIGVSNSTLLAKALSEALEIPFAIARLQPLTPSRILPPMVLSGSGRKLPGLLSVGAHHLLYQLIWRVMRPAINDIVRPQLKLRPYPRWGPYLFSSEIHGARVINGFSRHVLPRPADWPASSQVTGYWFLKEPRWEPSPALAEFLAAGPKPIYVGFGSMVSSQAGGFTDAVLEAVKRSGERALLATGWGGLDAGGGCGDDRVFFIRHAPHDYLFPRVAAAVHHGGAGTTAAAVRAGIPSVLVPFYGDQPFWARCLARQAVAPPAVERKSLTPVGLASAIAQTQQPAMVQRAAALGRAIRAEDGIAEALRWLETWKLLPATERASPIDIPVEATA
ncbi:MAG TPA: glycosyltransferase [Acidobacteriaceae bacterium]|jgi:UDP:flavonoid glycosyltransferase YjiC (YdhE family)|nr:glycosyltransferase [Acidobacteriaceae bacterium]